MAVDGVRDLAHARPETARAALERGLQVPEQPRATLAAAAHDDAVHTRVLDHPHRVLGREDVPVAEHGDVRQGLAQPRDRVPVRGARVVLLQGAPVQRDGGHALVPGHAPGVQVGLVLVVDADAHLHRHGNVPGLAHRGAHDRAEQVRLPRQGGAAAALGDLGHGAAEVEVDVVRAVLLRHHPHGFAHVHGVHTVDLDGARGLVRVVVDDPQGLRPPLHQGARRDHLGHVQSPAVLAAQLAEGLVGHPGHGGQHHGDVDGQRSQVQRLQVQHGRFAVRGLSRLGAHRLPLSHLRPGPPQRSAPGAPRV